MFCEDTNHGGKAQAFLSDIGSNPNSYNKHIADKIATLDVDFLKAWQLVYRAKNADFSENYRRDMALLQQVKNMLANTAILDNIGGSTGLTTILQKHYSAPCNTCINNNGNLHQNFMSEYLPSVVSVLTDHQEPAK